MEKCRTDTKIVRLSIMLALCAALLLMVLMGGSDETNGETITVDDDGGADHTTIKDALVEAEDGDTILVYAGTYHELQIIVYDSVTITGEGASNTTVEGYPMHPTFAIKEDWVNLSGFTVIASDDETGIEIKSSHNTISDNIVTGEEEENSHGILVNEGCDYNKILNNSCIDNGQTGLYLYKSDHNLISGNNISRFWRSHTKPTRLLLWFLCLLP